MEFGSKSGLRIRIILSIWIILIFGVSEFRSCCKKEKTTAILTTVRNLLILKSLNSIGLYPWNCIIHQLDNACREDGLPFFHTCQVVYMRQMYNTQFTQFAPHDFYISEYIPLHFNSSQGKLLYYYEYTIWISKEPMVAGLIVFHFRSHVFIKMPHISYQYSVTVIVLTFRFTRPRPESEGKPAELGIKIPLDRPLLE